LPSRQVGVSLIRFESCHRAGPPGSEIFCFSTHIYHRGLARISAKSAKSLIFQRFAVVLSGKRVVLPSPSPLRTDRASFPAISSSLSNARLSGRDAATYDCCCVCTFFFANDARGSFHCSTQARASSFKRNCFMFSTNSCFLHHRQRVSYRKT